MAATTFPGYPNASVGVADVGLSKSISAHLDLPQNKWLKDRFAKYGEGDSRSRFAWWVLAYASEPAYANTVPIEPVMLEPNGVNVRPEDPFWTSTPARQKVHDRLVKLIPSTPVKVTTTFDPIGAIAKIPVLGPVLKAAVAPLSIAVSLAQGERFDHALLDAAKSQLGGIKAIAPYAAAVVSFIPGIGTGVAAAIAAGAALAEGKTIDQALEEAIKGAIPGGALVAAGYELAKKVASGQNVGKAMLEAARSQLSPELQKAFDVGLAVVSGKQIQDAVASAIVSFAPNEVKQILDTGAKAIGSVPGLAAIAKALPTDIARQGLQLASGALAHAGVNETQIRAMRSKLTGDVLKGFDAALKAQAAHFPWAEHVVSQPPAPIKPGLTQAQLDLQALSKLSPEQQKQLVDLQALAKLSPEEQKKLVAYTEAKKIADAAPKPTPKPHEPPPKPAATPKPHEPPKKATAAAPPVVKSAAAPAAATPSTAQPGAPAPGGPHYGPYPSSMPGGAVHGALAGYRGYPSTLAAPPHLHPHGGHRGGDGHPHARPIQDGRTWGGRWPWWSVPFNPDAPAGGESCRVWGNPIALPPAMERAARAALGASHGNPTTVRGPDGVLYLFAFENGQLAARPCAAITGT